MRLELSLNNSGNKKATLDERLFGKCGFNHKVKFFNFYLCLIISDLEQKA